VVAMLVVAGGMNVLVRDQVRCHATPVSSSEPMPKSGAIVEVNRRYSLSSPRLTSETVS
jgi:hypothetical protein